MIWVREAWLRGCGVVGVIAVSCGCSGGDSDGTAVARQHIVGGVPVVAGAFSNVAWLNNQCTAVLVHPEVVLTAAHCAQRARRVGFFAGYQLTPDALEAAPLEGAREVDIERCAGVPNASLDDGTDLAACVLAQTLTDIPIVPLVAGCERAAISTGTRATLVGFGDDELGANGALRSVDLAIASEGSEYVIGELGSGTCAGDSGGPAFVRLELDPNRPEWRIAGILSSGEGAGCGLGYYVDVSRFLDWIEEATQRDVTPCWSDGAWAPTARCLAPALDASGVAMAELAYSATCGAAFDTAPADEQPPELTIQVNRTAHDPALLDVVVRAHDAQSGVARVELDLSDANDRSTGHRADEVFPFEFTDVPGGAAVRVEVRAIDGAGRVAVATARLDPRNDASSGCALGTARIGMPATSVVSIVLLLSSLAALRKRRDIRVLTRTHQCDTSRARGVNRT